MKGRGMGVKGRLGCKGGLQKGFQRGGLQGFGNFKDVHVLLHVEFWPFLASLFGHRYDLPKCHQP